MHLADYMQLHDLSDEDMAKKIKRSRPTVSRIRRGIVLPDWSTVEAIRRITNNAVTANDFMGERAAPSKSRERV